MQDSESVRFFKILSDLGIMFADELSKDRQRLYWEMLRDRMTIEEWEYAAEQAMLRETFHKVPLPSQLLDYGTEHRGQVAKQQALQRSAEDPRKVLEASPEWKRERAKQMEEEYREQKAHQRWLAEQSRDTLIALGLINPPDPRRWLPLTEDFSPEAPARGRTRHGNGGLERLVPKQKAQE